MNSTNFVTHYVYLNTKPLCSTHSILHFESTSLQCQDEDRCLYYFWTDMYRMQFLLLSKIFHSWLQQDQQQYFQYLVLRI